MADATVSELAKVVGVSEDKLLSQIKEAGLPHTKPDDLISNDDKNTLLVFLRRSHGDRDASSGSPKKITLKRKTIGTLKSASTTGRGKTVNVEVRKKRTYVKRTPTPVEPELEAQEEELKEALESVAEAETEQVAAEQASAEGEQSEQAAAEETSKEEKPAEASKEEDKTPVPDVPPEEVEAARAAKPAAKRKTQKEQDDEKEKKKSQHLRNKQRAQQGPKRHAKTLHANDDFVLEGDDFDGIGGRRRGGRRGKGRLASQHGFEKPTDFIAKEIKIGETNSVGDLAQKMSVKGAEVIKVLFNMGVMATINQALDRDTATLIVEEMGHKPKFVSEDAIEEQLGGIPGGTGG